VRPRRAQFSRSSFLWRARLAGEMAGCEFCEGEATPCDVPTALGAEATLAEGRALADVRTPAETLHREAADGDTAPEALALPPHAAFKPALVVGEAAARGLMLRLPEPCGE